MKIVLLLIFSSSLPISSLDLLPPIYGLWPKIYSQTSLWNSDVDNMDDDDDIVRDHDDDEQ